MPNWEACGTLLIEGPATIPKVMGIVNVTPDSFSDGGRNFATEEAIDHALHLVEQGADILVDWTLTGQGMFINPWGRAVPTGMGHTGGPSGGQGAAMESFIEAMLVVDMTDRASGLLIWRGVYREKQRDAVRIAQRLPDYAGKLLAGYPGKKP